MRTYADVCRALGDLAVFVLMLLVVLLGFQQACLSHGLSHKHTHMHQDAFLAAPPRMRTYAHVCSRMQAFTLQFGSQARDYSTLSMALISLFRTLLGDFRYEDLQASQLSSGLAGTRVQILS
jgi:hypothetical protein